jgi:hypothetical protein
MKRKLKIQELILVCVWLIILVLFFGDNVVKKASARFYRLDSEIAASQEKLQRLNAILKVEKELNAEYSNVFAGYRAIKDSDSLLQEIDSIAKKLNVNITNIKPESVKEETAFRSYSIKIEGQEDVSTLVKFLNVLTEEIRGTSIERLQFSAANRDELPKASITVHALVFKQ